jgi:hypothetical protein
MSNLEASIAASGGSIHEHRKATRRMRWWYEALADYMMANPKATQNEIAAHFGRAVSTISTIVNTDAFTAYMRQRREAHAATLDHSVREKLLGVADKGLGLILEQFEKKRDTIPLETLQRSVDSTLKSLGFGATSAPSAHVQVNVNPAAPTVVAVPVSVQDLQDARAALRRAQSTELPPSPLTIEGTAIPLTEEE